MLKAEAARLLEINRPKLFTPYDDDRESDGAGEAVASYSSEENYEDEQDEEDAAADADAAVDKHEDADADELDADVAAGSNDDDEEKDVLAESDDSDDGGRWAKKNKKKGNKQKKGHGSRLDSHGMPMDDFFSVDAMGAFLDAEDSRDARKQRKKREGPSGEEDDFSDEDDIADADNQIDMFADIASSDSDEGAEGGNNAMYGAFFDEIEGGDGDGNERSGGGRKASKRRKVDKDVSRGDLEDEMEEDEMEEDEVLEEEEEEEGLHAGADADEGDEDSGDSDAAATDDDADDDGEEADASTKGLFDDEQEEEEEEVELSKYEKQQRRIQAQIDELEEFNASDKPWQLKGEVGGGARPMDSLLQEDLDFDVMTRAAPEITEETTVSLEDMIVQRIKDSAYDDVERKEDPKNMAAYQPADRIELDGDKSTVGLGELYEDDYQRQASGSAATASEERVEKQHAEITELLGTLNTQLNALTNFHFTPPNVHAEITVQTNAPAISLEEAQPAAGSTASQMAPEEIYGKSKGDSKGDSEKTTTDKKRERRAKKKLKHEGRLERERKQKAKGLAGTVTKAGALAKLVKQSNVTVIEGTSQRGNASSKKFFNELSQVGDGKKKKGKDASATTGSKLRL